MLQTKQNAPKVCLACARLHHASTVLVQRRRTASQNNMSVVGIRRSNTQAQFSLIQFPHQCSIITVIMKKYALRALFSIVLFDDCRSKIMSQHERTPQFAPVCTMLMLSVRSNQWILARFISKSHYEHLLPNKN